MNSSATQVTSAITTGGGGGCNAPPATGTAPMIDDFEDNDSMILPNEGRFGHWYWLNDGTGTQTATPVEGAPGADGVLRSTGSGFTEWGAGVSVDLNYDFSTGNPCEYDASFYTGVQFHVTTDVPLSFKVALPETQADSDHYEIAIPAGTDGVFKVPFAMLIQPDWAPDAVVWDPAQILELQWYAPPEVDFTFTLDDLAFYRSATTSGSTGGTTSTASSTTGSSDVQLIDDFEDGNNQLATPTYSGYWFTSADESGSGSVTPNPGDVCSPEDLETPRDASNRAMHVSGSWVGGDAWIAALGVALQADESSVVASSYAGVAFYARTDDEDTEVRLEIMIEPVEDDGHFAIPLPLTNAWQLFEVTWDNPLLVQPTWAEAVTFDPSQLSKFQFQFESENFDLWVDDVRFIEP